MSYRIYTISILEQFAYLFVELSLDLSVGKYKYDIVCAVIHSILVFSLNISLNIVEQIFLFRLYGLVNYACKST